MKREEIKNIFPEATDEQLKAVMDLNGGEVEKNKKLEAELKAKNEQFETLNKEFETLKSANADGEEWKAKFEALQAENAAKEKQAEADRILKEKNESINKRFETARGEKIFSHDAIKEAYLKKFGEALESEDYKGKSDIEVFHELTKDDDSAFKGAAIVKLAGGKPSSGKAYNSKADIMAIKDRDERRAAIADNLNLFEKGD